jgi:hypothetical protein
MITKKQLRKKFNKWLGDEFDNKNKKSEGETHRWILCYNGEYKESSLNFDYACCLSKDELDKCGCYCHSRIGEIVNFFWRELLKIKKQDEVDFSSYDAINAMQDDLLVILRLLGLKDCARDISPHIVMINEIFPAIIQLIGEKKL